MFAALHDALNPALFWEYRVTLLTGLKQNVYIFIESAILAVLIAFVVGTARLSQRPAVRWAATAYTEFFRNTPEYVLLVWIYFVLPLIIGKMLGTHFKLSPHAAAVIGLGIACSGFMSETVRAGLRSISSGQTEAALSLGMSRFTMLRRIMLPQAVRRMLPEAINSLVSLFKSTTIVSLITVQDIMYQVSMVSVAEMRPVPLYTGAALLYCAVIILATQVLQQLTEKWRGRGWA
ncbi:amino acid ABC transporter permease [Bradyrhizobium sp. Ash2021]|uniref:amino acid ABC transporter permease n=1 Tax=Bradyrhizobium sp. Ash2021 TaxID=2954771 RepID=UPI0028150F80|nr:amino acid ABC transporter permease [Bradyrhizobium sp. Ash2021]WMT79610.1 amino acid ABC transporter permease [Bradyrhizobium sp. Ash2021]